VRIRGIWYNAVMVDFKKFERIHKAVANRRRLAILAHLKKEKEVSVGKIATHIKLSFKSTSRHLSVLLSADLVERNQRGVEMFYRLSAAMHPIVLETLRHISS